MSLTLQPITYPEACAFVAAHHRHHLPPQGWKFGIAVNDGQKVVGVDIVPQPRYPFAFVQADALEYVAAYGHEFDVIHASPPCQGYSPMRHLPWLRGREYPLLIDATRAARKLGRHYLTCDVWDKAVAVARSRIAEVEFGEGLEHFPVPAKIIAFEQGELFAEVVS